MTWLFDLLRAKGLLWESILPCNQIGVHPMNRNGAGTSASHVEELLTTFVGVGFCVSRAGCVCIEVPTGDATVSTFNESMARESQGRLAPVVPGSIRYASAAVRLRDAWLADAAQTGLKWTVLSHELFNIPRVAAGMNSTNHTLLQRRNWSCAERFWKRWPKGPRRGKRACNGPTSRRRCHGQSLQGQWHAPSCSRLSASLGAEPWLSSSMDFFGTCAQ